MGSTGARPLTLDSGALIALERRDGRVYKLLLEANRQGRSIYIPASGLAQAWRGSGPRMAPIAALLKRPNVDVPPLSQGVAQAIGHLCHLRATRDIVDAHVALVGRATDSLVVTSDPEDLQHLDPKLLIEAV